MADKQITDLTAASTIGDSDLLVLSQSEVTKKVAGSVLKGYAEDAAETQAQTTADSRIATKFSGMTWTATSRASGSGSTASYNASTNTVTLGLEKGADGTGAGDMTKATYDDDSTVENAGGIVDYVASVLPASTTYETATMLSSGWSSSTYSFESAYPHSSWNIEVSVANTATSAQYDAFVNAKIVGSSTNNTVKALGTVPSVNIPVLIRKEPV